MAYHDEKEDDVQGLELAEELEDKDDEDEKVMEDDRDWGL